MICIRTSLAAAGHAISSAIPASAEIVASTCRLLRYNGPITTVETFGCHDMQHGGNVMVNMNSTFWLRAERDLHPDHLHPAAFHPHRGVHPGGDPIAMVATTFGMATTTGGIDKRTHRS